MLGSKSQQVNAKMLKVVRGRLGMNQEELGQRLGVHRPDISKIERGIETPEWLIKFVLMAKLLQEANMSWEDVVMEFPDQCGTEKNKK
jgi:DNA-binding XRE family transcriptional regulator